MNQYSIFDCLYPKYKIQKSVRLIELFGGIGSQAKALNNLKINFEHWKYIDFDVHVVNSYNAIFNTQFIPDDIRNIFGEELEIKDTNKYCYILTYSFPCQDLSLAGKQKGMSKGSDTRSGLLWEVERLLNECSELPQILLMENVPEVIGKKNLPDFQRWQLSLENLGYKNYIKVLNAKDYGIPQNRKRCFMISLLGDYSYKFPQTKKLEIKLKDLLEDNVNEKYFLSDNYLRIFTDMKNRNGFVRGERFKPFHPDEKDIAHTITTKSGERATDNFLVVSEATKKGYAHIHNGDSVNLDYLNSDTRRGRVGKQVAQTLTTSCNQDVYENDKIRKLTELECWKLMGFSIDDFNKASAVNSGTQLYKQAGNSIVFNVLEAIFKELLI